jgi:PAS domain S-box-containing protein
MQPVEPRMKNPLLIVEPDSTVCRSIAKRLADAAGPVLTAPDLALGLEIVQRAHPAMVLLDADLPGSHSFMRQVLSSAPQTLIIAATDPQNLSHQIRQTHELVAEFICKPLDPDVLGLALARCRQLLDLRHKLQLAEANCAALARQQAIELIETERLLAVRQIVDRMSHFIAQVANDVQGGIKHFNELPYFVSIHNRDGRVLAANPTYHKYLGNRIGRGGWEIYSGKRATAAACPVGRTLKSGHVLTTSALVRYASGAKVPVLVHTAPIYNNDGEVQLVLEIFAGSKEIEKLAAEIRTTQQRYQQLFDAVPSLIAVLDRRLRITACNRRFQSEFGDHAGRGFFEILRPGSFPAYRDPITRTLKTSQPQQGEVVLTDQQGTQYNMMAWTTPLKTAAGKLIQVLVIFTDITELRTLQRNLASLGMMLGTVSHDLKGSLTGLDAGLYLIDSGFYRNQPGRIEEGLDVAKLMLERIKKMVYDILFYAKERELTIQTVDASQFAAEVAANLEARLRTADIAFDCDFPQRIVEIEIDPDLMRTALINLLENAMEACIEDPAEKALRIEFRVAVDGEDILFQVRDNGVGIKNVQKDSVFDLFYSSKGRRGTGLGLFLTKKAVLKHGGTIEVDSRPEQGSCFTIRLPRRPRQPGS